MQPVFSKISLISNLVQIRNETCVQITPTLLSKKLLVQEKKDTNVTIKTQEEIDMDLLEAELWKLDEDGQLELSSSAGSADGKNEDMVNIKRKADEKDDETQDNELTGV